MFHFPGCPSHELWIHSWMTAHYHSRVPPFGNSRIKAYLQLPSTYRSLSRPSSAISALASTLRSYSLDLASFGFLFTPKTIEMIRNPVFAFHPPALLTGIFRFNSQTSSQKSVSFLCSFQGAKPLYKGKRLHKGSQSAGVDSNHRPLAYQASALTC